MQSATLRRPLLAEATGADFPRIFEKAPHVDAVEAVLQELGSFSARVDARRKVGEESSTVSCVEEAPVDADFMQQAHPTFIYGSVRPRLQPTVSLQRGIFFHIPANHLVAPLAQLSHAGQVIGHAVFIHAGLHAAAYESIAPADRRLQE
eukprot:3645969-Amphidinium_carterae.1